jgi:hypothetical protein
LVLKTRIGLLDFRAISIVIKEFISLHLERFLRKLDYSNFEQGVKIQRWSRSDTLVPIVSILKYLYWFLFVLGSIGALIYARKHLMIFSVSIFVLYYLAVLFLIFYNPRFFVPLIPFLAIFTSMVLSDLIIASRKSQTA